MADDAPWYEDGLRFACTGCGKCCSGEPGAVWVDDSEIAMLAAHVGMDERDFVAQHTRLLDGRRSLRERPDHDCAWLDPETRHCSVYEVRPVQCRTWPFWPMNVATPYAWRATQGECPGAGRGDLVPLESVLKRVRISERIFRR